MVEDMGGEEGYFTHILTACYKFIHDPRLRFVHRVDREQQLFVLTPPGDISRTLSPESTRRKDIHLLFHSARIRRELFLFVRPRFGKEEF